MHLYVKAGADWVPLTSTLTTGGITAVVSASFQRPANTTAYASGDLVADSTVAGSVAPMQLAIARLDGGSGILRRLRLYKSGTNLTSAAFRVHLFSSAPAVVNGDNGAFSSNGVASYIGRADITLDQAFTDGAWGSTDSTFGDMQIKLDAGQVVYALIEARAAYTPISAEVFTLRAEVLQD